MTDYLPIERINEILDECVEKGCEYVFLAGGDPFIREDIIDIIDLVIKKGLGYFISTKSYLDKATCQRLKSVGLKRIQISLDSINPDTAAFMAGMRKDFFERIIETLQNLNDVGIEVRLKAVITRYNIDDISEYLEFCKTQKLHSVHLVQYARSLWIHDDQLFPTDEQLEHAKKVIDDFKNSNSGNFYLIHSNFEKTFVHNDDNDKDNILENRIICSAARMGLTILPNGEVTVCEQLPYKKEIILGDLSNNSIEEVWNSEKLLNFISPPPRTKYPTDCPCRECEDSVYEKCHVNIGICIRDTYHYFKTFNQIDIRCKLSKVKNLRLE